MIRYLSPFKPQSLNSGSNIAYVTPNLSVAQIRAITLHNATNAPISAEVYLLPQNVAVIDNARRLVKKTIGTGESYLCPEVINHILTDGMQIILVGEGLNAMVSLSEQST